MDEGKRVRVRRRERQTSQTEKPSQQKAKQHEAQAQNKPEPVAKTGYKSPPLHSRFKKGQSGNPHGRPKGKIKTLDTLIYEMADKKIRVKTENGYRWMTRREMKAQKLWQKALQGDWKSSQLIKQVLAEKDKIYLKEEEPMSTGDYARILVYQMLKQHHGRDDLPDLEIINPPQETDWQFRDRMRRELEEKERQQDQGNGDNPDEP